MLVNLDEFTFADFVNAAKNPVVVDYWAEWCGPCRMMNPILKELSEELEGKVIFAKVDVDANPDLSSGIVSIPTLKVFVNGFCIKEITGAKPKPALLKELEDLL